MLLTATRLQRVRTRRRFYQEGASWIFPDVWEEYISVIPEVRPLPWLVHGRRRAPR